MDTFGPMWKAFRSVWWLEQQQDWRQKQALSGILLYVLATVFICYLGFQSSISAPVWNALFYIILLFGALNAVTRSFLKETKGKLLYAHTLFDPRAFLLGKMAYNAIITWLLGLATFVLYSLFIRNMVQDVPLFVLVLSLASIGFSSILTMVSAIAAKAGNNVSLMAVLSFPMLIPELITVLKASKLAVDGLDRSLVWPSLIVLLCLQVLVMALGWLLFPYLWKE